MPETEVKKYPLQRALESMIDDGYLDGRVRSYSGRGMNGRECLAFCPEGSLSLDFGIRVVLWLKDDMEEEGEVFWDNVEAIMTALEGTREDSMGLGRVYYWPVVPFVGEEA